jgi:hypothetical protein
MVPAVLMAGAYSFISSMGAKVDLKLAVSAAIAAMLWAVYKALKDYFYPEGTGAGVKGTGGFKRYLI